MDSKDEIIDKLTILKDNEHLYFNMFQDGGAVCYKCNGMYLLFEISQYGINEYYEGTYSINELDKLVDKAFSFT